MLCKNCGKHIYKSAEFCSKCGAKNEKPKVKTTNIVMPNAYTTKKSSFAKSMFWQNKKLLIALVSISCAIIIGLLGLLTWVFFINKINVANYIDIDGVEGLNGYASLEYDFNYVKLAKDLDLDDIRDIKELEELEEDGVFYWGMKTSELKLIASQYNLDLNDFIRLYKAIEIKEDNNGRLKNGDKAKIEVIVSADNDEFDKKLVGGKVFFQVDDLEKAIVIDLFDAVNIVYSGEDGNGTASFSPKSADAWMSSIIISSTRQSGLSNGDTITLTAKFVSDATYESLKKELVKDGMHLPKSSQKDFTVAGLYTYAEFDDITDEILDNAFSVIKSTHMAQSLGNISEKDVFYIDGAKNVSDYYMEAKNAIVINLTYTENLDIYNNYSGTTKNMVCMLANIVKNTDGTIGFTSKSTVLFEGYEMNSLEIVDRLNDFFVGYQVIAIR